MNWFTWVLLAADAIVCYCIGYSHGYWYDKKETNEILEEAKDVHEKALANHNRSAELLRRAEERNAEARKILKEAEIISSNTHEILLKLKGGENAE